MKGRDNVWCQVIQTLFNTEDRNIVFESLIVEINYFFQKFGIKFYLYTFVLLCIPNSLIFSEINKNVLFVKCL